VNYRVFFLSALSFRARQGRGLRLEWNSFETVSSSGARGIWTLKVSLAALMLTATFQVFIVAMSGVWRCSRHNP